MKKQMPFVRKANCTIKDLTHDCEWAVEECRQQIIAFEGAQ